MFRNRRAWCLLSCIVCGIKGSRWLMWYEGGGEPRGERMNLPPAFYFILKGENEDLLSVRVRVLCFLPDKCLRQFEWSLPFTFWISSAFFFSFSFVYLVFLNKAEQIVSWAPPPHGVLGSNFVLPAASVGDSGVHVAVHAGGEWGSVCGSAVLGEGDLISLETWWKLLTPGVGWAEVPEVS